MLLWNGVLTVPGLDCHCPGMSKTSPSHGHGLRTGRGKKREKRNVLFQINTLLICGIPTYQGTQVPTYLPRYILLYARFVLPFVAAIEQAANLVSFLELPWAPWERKMFIRVPPGLCDGPLGCLGCLGTRSIGATTGAGERVPWEDLKKSREPRQGGVGGWGGGTSLEEAVHPARGGRDHGAATTSGKFR